MTETAKKNDIVNHQNNNNLQPKITIDLNFFFAHWFDWCLGFDATTYLIIINDFS